jgi:hypothetical protein
MLDTTQIQTIAQLIDNIELSSEKLEKSFKNKKPEDFKNSKEEIIKIKTEISKILDNLK